MQTVMQVAQAAQPYMLAAHLHDHLQGSELHVVRSCYQAYLTELDLI